MRIFASLAVVVGCAPGTLSWPTGDDAVRTALWNLDPFSGMVTVALSNGIFHCEVTDSEDPVEVLQILAEARTAACREGARHVTLRLYKLDEAASWEQRFPGFSAADEPWEVYALGSYAGVAEARARQGDLVIEYVPTRVEWAGLPESGWVDIDTMVEADELSGSFSFGEAHVSGSFRASHCPVEGTWFSQMADAVLLACDG